MAIFREPSSGEHIILATSYSWVFNELHRASIAK